MLTKDQKNYLKKIPLDKKVKIFPFSRKAAKTAEGIIQFVQDIYPYLEVKHMGGLQLWEFQGKMM